MVRFMIVLLAVAAVYFGWQWYAKDAAANMRTDVQELMQPAVATLDPAPADREKTDQKADPPVRADSGEDSTADAATRFAARIAAHEAAALESGYQAAMRASEPGRGRVLAALAEAAAGADVELRMQLLGAGNAFLHSAEGRKQARATLSEILRLDAERAVIHTCALLEKCMRGPITRQDDAAHALVDDIYERHLGLVDSVVFNPSNLTKARSHKVSPGESLDRIAARFRRQGIKVEGWTLCYINRVGTPNRLQAGKTIKIPMEPIWTKVEKESFLMAVYVGDLIVRLYWIGHGKEGRGTPETTFTIADKLPDPDWYAPDGNLYPFGHPKNVLGRYFVKFDHETKHGFGAHGTAEPDTICTRSSLGCVRMKDRDIEEYFRFVPRGTKVVVAATR